MAVYHSNNRTVEEEAWDETGDKPLEGDFKIKVLRQSLSDFK